MTDTHEMSERPLLSADRLKAFTDGVVAIAMTLLILPLMEGVIDLGREGRTVLEFLAEDTGQLFSFVMSFVLIASFWMSHHRVFDRVDRTSGALVWLTIAWMLTIVWLPVPTAMLGAMPDDAAQKCLYVGTLILASLVLLAIRGYLLHHRELHDIPEDLLRAGIRAEWVTVGLFAIALTVALTVPVIGYSAMFLMLLTGPVIRVVKRLGRGRRPSR
ncbi:TMEM175 family protein [Microbacterium sp. 22195]|uniref:TMEM175 family protein n=1 Tax=Microbacterium sp. 22195 TaxID=3453891 RepID=UPI003F876A1C